MSSKRAGITLAFGIICLSQAAQAVSHHGGICTSYAGGDEKFFHHTQSGVINADAQGHYVTCPLSRTTEELYGATILVNIEHSLQQTTKCTAYSYPSTGVPPLASISEEWKGKGFHEFNLKINGYGKSSATSTYSVWCFLGSGAKIYGLDLKEHKKPTLPGHGQPH